MAATKSSSDSELLTALRHPLRRQILLLMLAGKQITPREIADGLEEPLSNVSYHVRVLAECEAIELVGTEPVRGSLQHFYKFTVEEDWALALLTAENASIDGAVDPGAGGDGDGGDVGES